ncbi:MAG: hypothetical protein P1R58_04860 [bacterium]|nr:hypothetical protein [bacterium]
MLNRSGREIVRSRNGFRVDWRFNYSNSNLAVDVSIWNLYSRENIAIYYWNETEKTQDILYQ